MGEKSPESVRLLSWINKWLIIFLTIPKCHKVELKMVCFRVSLQASNQCSDVAKLKLKFLNKSMLKMKPASI